MWQGKQDIVKSDRLPRHVGLSIKLLGILRWPLGITFLYSENYNV